MARIAPRVASRLRPNGPKPTRIKDSRRRKAHARQAPTGRDLIDSRRASLANYEAIASATYGEDRDLWRGSRLLRRRLASHAIAGDQKLALVAGDQREFIELFHDVDDPVAVRGVFHAPVAVEFHIGLGH